MSSDRMSAPVQGEIVIGKEIDSFSGAKATIYLEDVSLADASAQVVARQTIPDISHQAGTEKRIPFNLPDYTPEERASYTVRVHLSRHDSQDVRVGDCITMQSYPVLTGNNPDRTTIFVREVK